jgi:transcriptional regulator with XRE-family HTH domain
MDNPIERIRLQLRRPDKPHHPLTQQDFAALLGVSTTVVWNAESGIRPLSPLVLHALAELGHDPGKLQREYDQYRAEVTEKVRAGATSGR